MRLLGRRRYPLIKIRSRDDATLARPGASMTKPLRLVSVGAFHKAFGTAICQRDIHHGYPLFNSRQLDMVSISNFIQYFTHAQTYFVNFPTTIILRFRMCLSELIWMPPSELPFIQKTLVKCLPGVWSGGRLAKPHPPATGFRSRCPANVEAHLDQGVLARRGARRSRGRSCHGERCGDPQTLELLAREFGRTVLSGAGAECAHRGSLRGSPGDETSGPGEDFE
jgi:hypothetical protein